MIRIPELGKPEESGRLPGSVVATETPFPEKKLVGGLGPQ